MRSRRTPDATGNGKTKRLSDFARRKGLGKGNVDPGKGSDDTRKGQDNGGKGYGKNVWGLEGQEQQEGMEEKTYEESPEEDADPGWMCALVDQGHHEPHEHQTDLECCKHYAPHCTDLEFCKHHAPHCTLQAPPVKSWASKNKFQALEEEEKDVENEGEEPR